MPSDGQLLDYESVTPARLRRRGAGPEDLSPSSAPRDGGALAEGGDAFVAEAEPRISAAAAAPDAARPKKKQGLEQWGARRGHLLSYLGLFLFTFILYYRPYEHVSALASLTSMAFWTGILTLAVFFPTQVSLEGTPTARPREVNLVLLFCLTALLSIPLAIDRAEAWGTFVDPFIKAVLMFLVIVNTVRTMRRLRWMLFLGLSVGCVVSATAINDYRLGQFTVEGYRVTGSIGNLFGNPNDMAIHLITMIPIAVAFLFSSRGVHKKLVYAACVALLLGGTMVTYSRGGFLGLVGAGAVLAWKFGRRNRLAVMGLLAVATVLLVAFAPGGYGKRLLSIFDSSYDPFGSASARRELLIRSFKIAINNPLLGIGMNNFHIVSIREAVSHNSYAQVAAEMGLGAMAIYTMFIVTPLRRLRRVERETFAVRRDSRFYYLSAGLQASLVAYLIGSFFGSIAYQWYVYYLVGYAVALRRIYAVESAEGAGSGTAEAPSAGRRGVVLYDTESARVVEGRP